MLNEAQALASVRRALGALPEAQQQQCWLDRCTLHKIKMRSMLEN
jgi:hypothetical protein